MTEVYLIPSPIGDRFADFSVAGLRAIEKLPHLFLEADDGFVERLRRRGILGSQALHFMDDMEGCLAVAARLLESGTSFGVLASSGLPCFVDPGHQIVDLVLSRYLGSADLVPVGMSSALDAALAMSGAPLDRFVFLGHYPECHSVEAPLLCLGLAAVCFVRGPSVRSFLGHVRDLSIPTGRLLFFRDIRKVGRFRVEVLESCRAQLDAADGEGADYAVTILPAGESRARRRSGP